MKKILLLIISLLTTTLAFSQAGDNIFVHTATSGNISGSATYIDNPLLNNNPSAQFVVTHSLDGDGSVTYNDHTTGLYYNSTYNKWTVYYEDSAPMEISTSYNIFVPGTGAQIITATSPGGNYYFTIDDPLLNNNPDLHPIITHVWSASVGWFNYNCGVYYAGTNKWGIYTEDGVSEIPAGTEFFVLIKPSETGYNTDRAYSHIANAGNQTSANGSALDHLILNNTPNANFINQHDFGTAGLSDHVIGNYYSPTRNTWEIFSEDSPLAFSGEEYHIIPMAPAPVNDDCVNATALTVGANFNDHDITATLLGADGSSFGGVWFTTTVPGTGHITIETDYASGSTMDDTWMAVYTGSCGSTVFVTSNDDDGNGNFSKVVLDGFTPGETLLIKIEEDMSSSNLNGPFKISAYDHSLGIAENVIEGFQMYPNPAEDIVNLSADTKIDQVVVYNTLGQKVMEITPAKNATQIDISNLDSGVYMLKVHADNQVAAYQLIVE